MSEKQQCAEKVPKGGGQWGFRSCERPVAVEREGKRWCSIHDPVRVAEKRAQREAKWDAEREATRLAAAERAAREARRDVCEADLARVTAERDEAIEALRVFVNIDDDALGLLDEPFSTYGGHALDYRKSSCLSALLATARAIISKHPKVTT